MKAVLILFDSLNKDFLNNYNNERESAKRLINFDRLSAKSVSFNNSFAGSLPCIPARRELHTGRYNFLHREWGPLEPFDDSMPQLLKDSKVYTHLISDHLHYWEDGGGNYHTRYNSWEIIRGQEGDHWKGQVKDPEIPKVVQVPQNQQGTAVSSMWRYDWVNRPYINSKETFPQNIVFDLANDFINVNKEETNWFLQIESFDPHEPFFVPDEYLSEAEKKEVSFDWPRGQVEQTKEEVAIARSRYERLLEICDENLGKILDTFDENDMWKDTMLIVGTDHGFLLSEHGFWGKNSMPYFNEVANTPLFIWDPRGNQSNVSRNSIVQLIDWAPTLLSYFDVKIPKDMQGKDLKDTIREDKSVRNSALFGTFSEHINVTDGEYVYMRAPEKNLENEIYNYTLMPMHMKSRFSIDEMMTAEFVEPFDFTKGIKLLKIKSTLKYNAVKHGTLLYHTVIDPKQITSINDNSVEERLINEIITHMRAHDAPVEQYIRYGFKIPQ